MIPQISLQVVGTHELELRTDGTLVIRGEHELTLEPELVRELSSFFRLLLAQEMIDDARRERERQPYESMYS